MTVSKWNDVSYTNFSYINISVMIMCSNYRSILLIQKIIIRLKKDNYHKKNEKAKHIYNKNNNRQKVSIPLIHYFFMYLIKVYF